MNHIPVTLYLLFQIFVANVSTIAFPPQGQVDATVQNIAGRIGTTGDAHHILGFALGPISFNQSDAEVRKLIAESFAVARKRNVAVAFHIDDHMFWEKRSDLSRDKANIEWIDWHGTECKSRRLDWGPQPMAVAPQLCFNSPAIKQAVGQRARLIGGEIKRQTDRLKAEGREKLFAGIITGWETQIGRDYATNRSTGYHALSNAGFNAKTSSAEGDAALVKIVKDYIEMWAKDLVKAGVPREKIYAHVAFTPQGLSATSGMSYAQQVGFATPDVVFSSFYRPGFSTYPLGESQEQICREVSRHGNPPWISAEGTNVVPNGMAGESTMESYLAKLFNHGAVMVNIYSWGMGGEAEKNNMFRRATESDEAVSAYRKFLDGKILQEQPRHAGQSLSDRLPEKIHAIQAGVPAWVRKTGRPDLVQALMVRLDASIKANHLEDADRTADEILRVINAR